MPRVDPEAELASLKAHSEFFRRSRETGLELDTGLRNYILQVCEDAYKAAKYSLPEDFLTRAHYERVLRQLEYTSSPGYPYMLEKSTIGDWLGWDGVFMDEMQVSRLWEDVQQFLQGGLESLYRVFIKHEPHTIAKAMANRWRLIICPPLCEQVAWTMVFGPGNDREIETTGSTPSYQGMVLSGGGWKEHLRRFQQDGLDVSLDKSAWDWTAHWEWIQLDLELRCRLITSSRTQREQWRTIAERMYERAFNHPTLVLSDGSLYRQIEPGVMKSGCVNTISSNSHMQIFCHIYACLRSQRTVYPLPVAVGDDTLSSRWNTPTPGEYALTGAVVKDSVQTEDLEFVGHVWRVTGPVPSYTSKHIVRFAMVKEDDIPSFLDSMVRLYAHDDQFQDFWRRLAFFRNVSLPSEGFVRFWYDWSDAIWG